MTKKNLAVLNLIVIIIFIISNVLIGMNGVDGNNVATISEQYVNLFTPATYAFGIWFFIFVLLLFLGISQVKMAYQNENDDGIIKGMGPWLILANLAASVWLYLWVTDQILMSVIVMFACLLFLLLIIVKLNMQTIKISTKIRWNTWFPISIYAGWITVASVANMAAYLTKQNFQNGENQVGWAIGMIIVASIIYIYMMKTRNLYFYTLVGSWGLFAVSANQADPNSSVQFTALIAAAILAIWSIYDYYKKVGFNWDSDSE